MTINEPIDEAGRLKKHCLHVETLVRDFIRRKGLEEVVPVSGAESAEESAADGLWLVALSGGADSVCLLRLLLRLGYRVEALHCNFHLRGAESNRDERFVRRLCAGLGVELHVASFDTRAEAARRGESIEMAARRLRYAWFEERCKALGAACIAVAHHQEDSAETLLLNLLRGSGLRGLCGIRPRNGHVVRPLLCLTRDDIERYLKAWGQDYVTDSTNLQTDCRRNEVRLRLLPLMEELNPSVRATLAATAERLAEAEAVYRAAVDRAVPAVFDGQRILLAPLHRFPSPEALFHEILAPYGFTPAQEESMLRAGRVGASACSERWKLLRDRESFLLVPREEQGEEMEIDCSADGMCSLRPLGQRAVLEWKSFLLQPDFVIPRSADVFCADADAFSAVARLVVRVPRRGDRFEPFGMKGSKLVSDYLTDRKLDRHSKEMQPLLVDDGRIAWVVGMRPARPFCLTALSRRALCFRLRPEADAEH